MLPDNYPTYAQMRQNCIAVMHSTGTNLQVNSDFTLSGFQVTTQASWGNLKNAVKKGVKYTSDYTFGSQTGIIAMIIESTCKAMIAELTKSESRLCPVFYVVDDSEGKENTKIITFNDFEKKVSSFKTFKENEKIKQITSDLKFTYLNHGFGCMYSSLTKEHKLLKSTIRELITSELAENFGNKNAGKVSDVTQYFKSNVYNHSLLITDPCKIEELRKYTQNRVKQVMNCLDGENSAKITEINKVMNLITQSGITIQFQQVVEDKNY